MQKIKGHFNKMRGRSLVVLRNGKPVIELGKINSIFNIASIRKTLLSALYGIYVEEGIVHLRSTLKELEINDNSPELTEEELDATVEDLLKMKSGVYHPANYETDSTKEDRPKRHSHKHGEYYYYNNWDANVLGTVFSKLTDEGVFESFKKNIGDKLGLMDFDINQCEYKEPDLNSIHRAYLFKLSSRDLAKFGNLYAYNGIINGEQIIPEGWMKESTAIYSEEKDGRGVGFYWYVSNKGQLFGEYNYPNDAIGFSGYPGHFLLAIPSEKLVVVYEHDIFSYEKPKATSQEFGDLISQLL